MPSRAENLDRLARAEAERESISAAARHNREAIELAVKADPLDIEKLHSLTGEAIRLEKYLVDLIGVIGKLERNLGE